MQPDRTLMRRPKADIARDELNQALALAGYRARDDGKVASTPVANTDRDAWVSSSRLAPVVVS